MKYSLAVDVFLLATIRKEFIGWQVPLHTQSTQSLKQRRHCNIRAFRLLSSLLSQTKIEFSVAGRKLRILFSARLNNNNVWSVYWTRCQRATSERTITWILQSLDQTTWQVERPTNWQELQMLGRNVMCGMWTETPAHSRWLWLIFDCFRLFSKCPYWRGAIIKLNDKLHGNNNSIRDTIKIYSAMPFTKIESNVCEWGISCVANVANILNYIHQSIELTKEK